MHTTPSIRSARNLRRAQLGITLLEALVALVISALGLLGVAAVQARLRTHSDVTKQRAEAVRIGQENLENLRAFGTLAADGAMANNLAYNTGVVDGAASKAVLATAVSTSTNTTYTVTQSVTASAVAKMKDIRVTVAWKDREGADQSVVLRSVIAGNDPKLAAALAIPPNGSPIKDPLGRDLRVPIPAKDLGDGTSAFKPNAAGALAFVFNNDTGNVTKKCTAVPATVTTAQITAAALSGYSCVDVNGLLLSGYVRFSYGTPDASNPNDTTKPLSIRIDLDDTAPPSGAFGTAAQMEAAYWPTLAQAVDHGGYTSPDCATQDSKTVRFETPVNWTQVNNGVTQTISSTFITAIVPVGTPVTAAGIAPHVNLPEAAVLSPQDLGERYQAYTCVVYPRDFSGKLAWNGRSLVVPEGGGWAIGSTVSTFKICRYSRDYNLNLYVWVEVGPNVTKIDNAEHAYAYLFNQIGLNNQNFLVINGNRNCPTESGVEVDGTGGENYTDETTVQHQF